MKSIVNLLIPNKLWINVSKTEAILVVAGTHQKVGCQHLSAVIDNKPLYVIFVLPNLGVLIDLCFCV